MRIYEALLQKRREAREAACMLLHFFLDKFHFRKQQLRGREAKNSLQQLHQLKGQKLESLDLRREGAIVNPRVLPFRHMS